MDLHQGTIRVANKTSIKGVVDKKDDKIHQNTKTTSEEKRQAIAEKPKDSEDHPMGKYRGIQTVSPETGVQATLNFPLKENT